MAVPVPPAEAPELLDTLVLAVVQGLTEFLPVSSSGHLVLGSELLGVVDAGLLLPIALHVGTLLAVLVVYRSDLARILGDLIAGRPREALLVVLGTVPAGLFGVLASDFFAERFQDGRAAAWGLCVTAALLAASDFVRRRKSAAPGASDPAMVGSTDSREVGVLDALVIGCAQALAIFPGISRSGSTIAAGLMRGLPPATAARFSFLLSIPAIGGAALLEARVLGEAGTDGAGGTLLLGVVVAAVVGWLSLRALLAFLARGAFLWFAAYCLAVGAGYLAFA